MAHWCLNTVDYDNWDLFAKIVPDPSTPHLRSRSSSAASAASTHSNVSRSSHSNSTHGNSSKAKNARIKFVLPTTPDGASVRIPDPSEADLAARADEELRTAMVCAEAQYDIPNILANWPCTALRMSSVLSPEACGRVFPDLDKLWTHFLHASIVRRPACRLRCLDLSGFVPSKAMVYTFLQLIPLLSYRYDLSKAALYDRIVSTHGLKDRSLLQNLSQFLDSVLGHPVFKRGKRIQLPGPLEITMDYLPLSADKLSLYCWLLASSLYEATNIFIKVRSAVFTYTETGHEFSSMDPMLPLEILSNSLCVQDIEGLAVDGVPPKQIHKVLADILPKFVTRGFNLQRLALSNTNADLYEPKLNKGLTSVINQCSGLRRLDISRSRVCGILGSVLRTTSLPLEFLNVSHCCLDACDLDAIFNSKHSKQLRDINLSYIYSNICPACAMNNNHDLNHNAWLPPEETGAAAASMEFWKDQTNISRHETQYNHEEDIKLMETVCSEIKNLHNLTILDMMTDKFGRFCVDSVCFEALTNSVQTLQRLKQVNIAELPLWDEDIYSFIEAASSVDSLQSVAITRSKDAPRMSTEDRFVFWKRLHEAKNGKMLRTSIGNFMDETQSSDESEAS